MEDARKMGKSELFSHFAERFDMKRTQSREFFDELAALCEKELKRTGEFVIPGMVKLVLVDTRDDSPTNGVVNEFFIGSLNPMLVQVPSLVYHGWKCISTELSLVVNVPSEPYDRDAPDEFRLEPHGTLPYDWARQDG